MLKGLLARLWHNARAGASAADPARAEGDARTLIAIDALIGQGDLAAADRALADLGPVSAANADVAMLRARLALKRGDQQEAIRQFQLAIAAEPSLAAAHIELGRIYAVARRPDDARACYERAVLLMPGIAELHNNLGTACIDVGRFDDARRSFGRALQLRPDFAEARNNLGRACRESGDYAAALDIFRALPDDFPARVNHGFVLNDLADFAQAHAVLADCVRDRPDHAAALCGLGEACFGLGRLDDAEIHLRASHARDPESASVRFALGNIALVRGDFADGWPLYDARTALGKFAHHYVRDIPAWSGEPLPGRTLLVYTEQGYGDVLLFARFLPLLCAARATVVFRCRSALARLLAGSGGVDRIVVAEEQEKIKADAAVALLSLGRVLNVARSDLPGEIPYIRAPEQAVISWRERLAGDSGIRVGLAWAGNSARAHERDRVPPADAYALLGQVKGLSFYNLQTGYSAAELTRVPLPLIDYSPELRDFADTAALIANLDLVISVDTSVAHLAGAMGKPTLLLYHATPDWRWAIAGADSPWYPTMKIFRRAGTQWDTALADVARALADFAAARAVY